MNICRVNDWSYQLDLPHEGIREMEEVEASFYRMSQHIRTREEHIVELNEELHFRLGEAGLGLSIVKRLVGLMGGKISIASSLGGGTVVYFCLTFGPVPNQDEKETVPAESCSIADMSAVRVLVARG